MHQLFTLAVLLGKSLRLGVQLSFQHLKESSQLPNEPNPGSVLNKSDALEHTHAIPKGIQILLLSMRPHHFVFYQKEPESNI